MKTQIASILSYLLISCAFGVAFSQERMQTKAVDELLLLDGQLNEAFWQQLSPVGNFTVNYPNPNTPSDFQTTVKLAYDNQAIYIGAILDDPAPDSVLAILSQRDDFGNADWFSVLIDPYGAGLNGFAFAVTAAGVEADAILNSQAEDDFSWNAVWKSKVVRTPTGWSLEMRIPLSQLRFPEKEIQTWKINFKRQVRRRRELSYWSPVDPQKYGEITQSGRLEGMVNLVSPLRLSFSPYTTAYVENDYNALSGKQEWRFRPRFGMDMKYGLSESFTLDATLVPDFGQTVSDNLILNLSPFEVRYTENRPFFLEGMDLFGIGDLFYTRRIGAPTLNGAAIVDSLVGAGNTVESAAGQAQLINATKVSGRTKRGLGIGVFNAIEQRSVITFRDSAGTEREIMAHPLTNYNVFVLSQNLPNNSNVSLVNTNVFRPEIHQVSNVTALETILLTKNRKYTLTASGQVSYVRQTSNPLVGHKAYIRGDRVQGALTYFVDYYETSDTYDKNDLGFMARNNFRGSTAQIKWTGFQPKGRFLRRNLIASTNAEYLYNPGKFAFWNVGLRAIGTFRNFLTAALEGDVYPLGEIDHFESRSFGMPVNLPASFMIGGFYSSDYAKKLALDFSLYNRIYDAKGMATIDGEISPRIRFSNRLFVVITSGASRYLNNYGYVNVQATDYAGQIILGTRDRWIVNNAVAMDYTFTNRMGLVLRLNHYWQEVNYSAFRQLQPDGRTIASAYTGMQNGSSLHNTSYNAFTIDVNFRWVIYPGSEIRFVWKYNIYASNNQLDKSYFKTFNGLFQEPQLNSFSVKALFFLDAGKVKRSNRRSSNVRTSAVPFVARPDVFDGKFRRHQLVEPGTIRF